MSEMEWDDAAVSVGNFMGANPQGLTQPQAEPEPEPAQEAPEPAQDAPEPEQAERLRDPETGQFTTEEKLYAGKFSTPEELEQDYNQRLGSMTNELGELRQKAQQFEQMQQYLAYQQQQAQQAQQLPGAYSEEFLSQFDEESFERPHETAEKMRAAGNEILYERAIDNWYSLNNKAPARYEAQLAAQAAVQHVYQTIGPALQPMAAQHQNQALTSAYLATMQRYPDMNQYGEQILSAAEQYPALLEGLKSPDQTQKASAFEALYHIARSNAGLAGTATGQAPAQAAVPGLQAALQATVASPNSIPVPPGQMTAKQEAAALLNDLWDQADDNG